MSYLGNAPESVFTEMKYQDLTGGSGTSFTLNQAVSNPQEIEVFVNNVRQEPSAAYSVSGTTLTMTESVGASEDFYVIFQGMAQGSATHPATQSLEAAAGTFTGDVAIDSDGGFLFDVSDKALEFGDNYKATFGDSGDLQIYHSGTDSLIVEQSTGNLLLGSNSNIYLYKPNTFETMLQCNANGAVSLYHDNSKKFETTSAGVSVTGTGTFSGAVTVNSGEIKATSGAVVQESNSIRSVMGNDGGSGVLGTSTNHAVKMFANNTNTVTFNTGGNLTINDGDLVIGTSGHGISFAATSDASGMSSEVLDDYEEGTFTPAYSAASSTAVATGRYTKIGRIVSLQVEVRAVQSGTTFGKITGFPFAISTQNYLSISVREYYSTGKALFANCPVGGTESGTFYQNPSSGTAVNGTTYGFAFSFTYHTA